MLHKTPRAGPMIAALALALWTVPVEAQTNGYVLQCTSARVAAQGCVTRAQDAVPTSLFRDPAGLVAFDGQAFEFNATPFAPSLTFENDVNARVDGNTHVYPLGSFAYVGPRLGKLAWAFGVEPIGGFGSDFQLSHALLSGQDGNLIDYESYFAAAKIGPAFAFELAPGFSVGASMTAVYAQIRDFRMPFTMPPTAAPGMAGVAQLDPAIYGPLFQQFVELTAYGDSEGYDGLTWTADLGVRYETDNGFRFAASWSPERPIDVDQGIAVIDMNEQFVQMLTGMIQARAQAYGETPEVAQGQVFQQLSAAGLDLQSGMSATYDAGTTITLPMTAGAGVHVPVTNSFSFAGEVEWRRWSTAEDVMPFNLTDGDNPNINLMMNGDPSNGSFSYPFPLNWEDAWSFKVGGTYALDAFRAFRAGFLYGQNPVPNNTVFITFPAISQNAVTAGLSWKIAGVPLDLSYVRAFENELTGVDAGHLLGSEYNNAKMSMSQNVFTIGTVLNF